jgi:hypothetical protein
VGRNVAGTAGTRIVGKVVAVVAVDGGGGDERRVEEDGKGEERMTAVGR